MHKINPYIWIVLAFAMLVMSYAVSYLPFDFTQDKINLPGIQTEIQNIVEDADENLDLILKSNDPWNINTQDDCKYALFRNNKLKYWTSNKINFEQLQQIDRVGIYRLSSRLYFVFFKQEKRQKVYGLIPLKKDFEIQNDFLKNKTFASVYIPDNYRPLQTLSKLKISIKQGGNFYNIYFKKESEDLTKKDWQVFLLIFYLTAILLLSIGVVRVLSFKFKLRDGLKIIILIIYAVLLKRFLLYQEALPFFDQFNLFKPFDFANSWIPSLGMLLIDTILLCSVLLIIIDWLFKRKEVLNKSFYYVFHGLALLSFILTALAVKDIIYNSTVAFSNFETALLGYQEVLVLLVFSLFLLTNMRLLRLSSKHAPKTSYVLNAKVIAFFYVPFFILLLLFDFSLVALFIVANIFIALEREGKINRRTNTFVLLLLSSVLLVLHINQHSEQKEQNTRFLYLDNYQTKNNRLSEYLISQLDQRIKKDSLLMGLIYQFPKSNRKISDYIQMHYLTGYWSKFQSETVVCGSENISNPPTDINSCENFFYKKLNQDAKQVETSNFVSINNYGLEHFLGKYQYIIQPDSNLVDLYIYLKPKEQHENLGYPSILLTQDVDKEIQHRSYSFAKYLDGSLISHNGIYTYKTNFDFPAFEGALSSVKEDAFTHLIEKQQGNAYNVITWKRKTVWSFFIALSYVFILFALVYYLSRFLAVLLGFQKSERYMLKDKLLLSFIGILMMTFVVLAIAIMYRSTNLSEAKQKDILEEKMKSILVELSHKFSKEGGLENLNESVLNYYLTKFSNVFFTDINLFDLNGELIASSRPEVFEKELVGRWMNHSAFKKIDVDKYTSYVHTEKIGTQQYLSAYTPFRNEKNQAIAYLNLPYFAKNDEVQKDITDLITALLNLFVLLFLLTGIFTIFISNRITLPLSFIQQKLKDFRVEKKNEQIYYQSKDEIGALINEYNKTVEELNKNIELLAQKEREGAWREMAKQIAHEIKNPLTPMKLSLQHLKYIWEQGGENREEKTRQTVDLVVRQIDRLAETASAFADFSKMTIAKRHLFDIQKLIREQAELFLSEAEIEILSDAESHMVYADEQQFSRVFQNLLSNAVQASKEEETPHLKIQIHNQKEWIEISVCDNGNGMDEETQKHLFKPYFTTKSSGTGLGLAIVKQIIDNNGGNIRFESEEGRGTCFFINMPQPRS